MNNDNIKAEYFYDNYCDEGKRRSIYIGEHFYPLKICDNCNSIYKNYKDRFNYCPKCGKKLRYEIQNVKNNLEGVEEFCNNCGEERFCKEIQLCGGERNDGFTEYYTHCHCYIGLCSDCAKICKNCGKLIITPEIKNLLKKRGESCEINPCDSCWIANTCECESPVPIFNKEIYSNVEFQDINTIFFNIAEYNHNYCESCQLPLSKNHKFCPDCGTPTIPIKDIKRENYLTLDGFEHKCDIHKNKNAKYKIKLFGLDIFQHKKKTQTCNCNLYLCDECVTICNECGKVILTDEIKRYLIEKGHNCKFNPCCSCYSLAFCNCSINYRNFKPTNNNLTKITVNDYDNYINENSIIYKYNQEISSDQFIEKLLSIYAIIATIGSHLSNIIGIIVLIALIYFKMWTEIFVTLIFSFLLVPYLLGLIMLIPHLIILLGANILKNRYLKFASYPLLLLGSIINLAIICSYGAICMLTTQDYSNSVKIPIYYLLSYIFATIPFYVMSKNDESGTAALTASGFNLSYLSLMIYNIFFPHNIITDFSILFALMLIPTYINFYIGIKQIKSNNDL